MAKNIKKIGEREILRSIRARAARSRTSGIRVGIGDDCAVLTPRAGEELVITTDFSIEDRHFRRNGHEPEAVGHKCLARGLSDVAAMGARPLAVFVSLAVPKEFTIAVGKKRAWISRFYDGLLALAAREKVSLAGGDLSESPSLAFADIVVVGAAPIGRALLRSTARAGDILYVTGTLGGAAAELAAVEQDRRPFRGLKLSDSSHPHFFPQPRLATGQALLRRKLATACIDISDGLSVDLLHLCEESDLSAELDASAIPVHPQATLEQALHGGDDYELLFTASPQTLVPRRLGGVTISPIGRVLPRKSGNRATLITGKATQAPLLPQGWQHF